MEPYASCVEHLLAELSRVYLRARLRFPGATEDDSDSAPDIDPADTQEALARAERDIAARAAATRPEHLRLPALVERFGLSPLDRDALLLATLPAVDISFERFWTGLQGNPARPWPTVDLLLTILCDSRGAQLQHAGRFEPGAPLVRHRLVEVFSESSELHPPLLSRQVAVDPRVVAYLLGRDAPDERLYPHAQAISPRLRFEDLLLPEDLPPRLLRFARRPGATIYLEGRPGSGRRAVAEALCAALGVGLLVADAGSLAGAEPAVAIRTLRLLGREAFFRRAAVLFTNVGAWLAGEERAHAAQLEEALSASTGLVLLSGEIPWEPSDGAADRPFVRVPLPGLRAAEQRALWRRELEAGADLAPGVDLEALTGTYRRLTPGQIRDAARAARDLAAFRSPEPTDAPRPRPVVSQADLTEAARLCSNRHLTSMGRKLQHAAAWGDLVLPPEHEGRLREICAHVRLRGRVMDGWGFDRRLSLGKGVTALFSGPPGTGKTMAAGVMANELGLELFHVDLSRVLSKYIGETEQHLSRLFDEAESSDAILFFDEADTLFGKRTEVKDAHDRNANLEASYMLQRLESYDGVAILASNLTKNMDEAFVRRFRFVVGFPYPTEEERRRIWERVFPPEVPLGGDVRFDVLAERIDLAGGHLRNIALCAAFFAAEEGTAVCMRHLLRAARGEYLKIGKVVDMTRFAEPEAGR